MFRRAACLVLALPVAGIYAKHVLDVTIQQGGTEANLTAQLLTKRLDVDICCNSFLLLNFVKEHTPFPRRRGDVPE